MKKLFSLVALLIMISLPAFAQQGEGHKHEKNEANSMVPNYMSVVFMHGEDLELTEEQSKTFAEWQQKFHVPTQEKMNLIIEKKKVLYAASIEEKSLEDILKVQDEIAKLMREIVVQKTNCRDKLQKVLTAEQWKKVVKMTRKMNA